MPDPLGSGPSGPRRAPVANAPSGPQPADLTPAVRPAAVHDRTLHMVGNAHLDPVWLWPWQEGYAEARATFWSAIHRMDEYPDFVFTCDQVVLLSWVEESDPELFARIRERVADGRWQLVGGWWVEPDCNLPGAESFVRQGLYGQRYLHDRFGVTATVGMNVDPFGHHAMLPQILRGQGMDSYCFLRPGPHEGPLVGTAFWWESADGSRVLGYRIPYEYCSPPGSVDGQTDKALGQLDQGLGDLMVFYGVGNHGGGPTRANIESIHRYDRMGSFGRLSLSHPRRYLDGLLDRVAAGDVTLPVWRRDLQMHAAGCYSAHSGIKAWQRRAQAAVLGAERWAVVGALAHGLDHPREELGRAWTAVLFNQFHDVLPGSAIEPAYDDARDQLGEAVAVAKRITTRVHNVIARDVDIPLEPGTQPVLVFNPHPWPVTAAVELQYGSQPTGVHVVDAGGVATVSQRTQSVATTDDRGRAACAFEAQVPALGYRLYRLRPGPAPADARYADGGPGPLRATDAGPRPVLENEVLRVEVDPATGWLASLLDKRTGVDLVAGARGEHTQVCEDPTDTWGHRVVSYAWPGAPMPVTRVVLRESGPLRARLRVERAWGRSTLVEELVLGHRSDALEVRVTLDWRERAHLLKLRVPVRLTAPVATYEIPFGSLERPVDGGENPGQSWVDLTGTGTGSGTGTGTGRVGTRPAGLAVVTDAKHGYDTLPGGSPGVRGGDDAPGTAAAESPSIGITAVRSPVYSWHDPRLLDPEGFYSVQDQGVQHWTYLLVPHGGDRDTARLGRRAAELGTRVRAMLETFHPGRLPPEHSYASDDGGAVMISAVKGSEDDAADGTVGEPDLVVRAWETTGRPARARLELPLAGRAVEAEFGPSQIRTFRVPRAGGDVVEVDLLEWQRPDLPRGGFAVTPLAAHPPVEAATVPGDAPRAPVPRGAPRAPGEPPRAAGTPADAPTDTPTDTRADAPADAPADRDASDASTPAETLAPGRRRLGDVR